MRIAIAAMLALASSAGSGQAAFPGGNGRLVFTQWTASTDRYVTPRAYLCSAAPDGSAQTRLTDTPARDGHSAFSADGSRLAFVRGASTTIGTLVIAAADGSGARELGSATQLSSPAWHRDGKTVVASRLGELVHIAVTDGSELRLVQTPAVAELDPEPSPNGTRLAYVTSPMTAPEPRALVVAAAGGSAPRELVSLPGLHDPSWSPDGLLLAVGTDAGIHVVLADGSGLRRLTTERDVQPEFSPDGTRIAFVRNGDVWTMRASDGGDLVRVTATTMVAETEPAWQPLPATPAAAGTIPCAITGTEGDDVLVGTEGPDVFCDRGGNDQIVGLGGDDVVWDGPGDDRIEAGEGDDIVFLSAGHNTVLGGGGDDRLGSPLAAGITDGSTLDGGPGDDSITGGIGPDRLLGGEGRDAIAGQKGPDLIFGGPGADRLQGNRGDDYLDGGVGDDVLYGGLISGKPAAYDGYDVMLGRGGNDRLAGGWQKDRLFGGTGDDRLAGGQHADYLKGEGGRDALLGERGDDLLLGRDGERDALWGGPGTDRATADSVDAVRGVERRYAVSPLSRFGLAAA